MKLSQVTGIVEISGFRVTVSAVPRQSLGISKTVPPREGKIPSAPVTGERLL